MPTAPNFLRARWAVALIFAINGFIYANWTSRLPRMREVYDIDNSQLGFILLSVSVGALIAMPLAGVVIVRLGSRQLTRIMLFAYILLTPLLAIMPNYPSLIFIGFMLGMSTGSVNIAMNAQAIGVEDGLNKPIMSSFHAIFSLGMLVGAGSSSLFIGLQTTLFTHLVTISLLVLPLAFWCAGQLLQDAKLETNPADKKASGGFRLHPTIVLIGLIAFCCMMGEGAMADWTPVYMVSIVGSTEFLAPFGQAAFSGAMTIGRLGGDWARGNYGSRKLIRGGGLLALVGLSIALFFPATSTTLLGFLLVGLGLSNIVPIVYSVAGRIPGIPAGLGISSVTTFGYAGFLLGPPIIGFISDWHNEAISSGIDPLHWWMNGSWRGLQFGLGFIWLLFVVMLLIAFFFLKIKDRF